MFRTELVGPNVLPVIGLVPASSSCLLQLNAVHLILYLLLTVRNIAGERRRSRNGRRGAQTKHNNGNREEKKLFWLGIK